MCAHRLSPGGHQSPGRMIDSSVSCEEARPEAHHFDQEHPDRTRSLSVVRRPPGRCSRPCPVAPAPREVDVDMRVPGRPPPSCLLRSRQAIEFLRLGPLSAGNGQQLSALGIEPCQVSRSPTPRRILRAAAAPAPRTGWSTRAARRCYGTGRTPCPGRRSTSSGTAPMFRASPSHGHP
jgi:hypothetical protein